MLGDIVKHLTPDRTFEEYYGKLHGIMSKLLTIVDDFPSLFAMVRERGRRLCSYDSRLFQDKILPYLDLFQRENIRVDLFKSILHAFINKFVADLTRCLLR